MRAAIEDLSYYELFDVYYAQKLAHHKVFERKLIFLENTTASYKTIQSINRYGIATFIVPKKLVP
ncbi:MAG: hypothetical protein ACJAVV_003987 [Alphaproteobacteria bacterium]|jgi:hypothetical protein